MSDDDFSMRQYAGSISKISSSLKSYGIDTSKIMMVTAAMQGISGASAVYNGYVSAVSAVRAIKSTEYAANLAKWGPYAVVIAAASVAAGYAAGDILDRYANQDLSTSEGQRALTLRVSV
jgi:hypothetical protein